MSTTRSTCACGECASCSAMAGRPAVADPLAYRHGAIKARLLARIGSTEIDGRRPLDPLGTRDDDDPTIALIDAFSGAIHVLAWNAARLSDDGSIRRTEDRDALVDLARLLGYEPRPALSATTTLAVEVESFPGSPTIATVPKGTKVASVPRQDEVPQTFETAAELEARVEWNELLPVQQKDVPKVDATTTSITIEGTDTAAKPGDLVLAYLEPQVSQAAWLLARVAGVERFASDRGSWTRIDLASPSTLPAIASLQGDKYRSKVVLLGQRAAAFGATAPDYSLVRDTQQAGTSVLTDITIVAAGLAELTDIEPTVIGTGAAAEWPGLEMSPGDGQLDLDAVYPDVLADRCVVFSSVSMSEEPTRLGRITGASELSRSGFGLSAKVTRMGVEGIDLTDTGYGQRVRDTAIYIETGREQLLLQDVDLPMPPAPTDRLVVQDTVDLPVGRRIVLAGEKWTSSPGKGPIVGEVATLKSSAAVTGGTELVFDRPIATTFRSPTLRLLANCVGASHGETPASGAEVIGSASTASLSPTFPLTRTPLTYVPAPADPRGYAPAIEVRVGERAYGERPSLFGLTNEDRAFSVTSRRGDTSEVQFAGRLPSGTFNVSALYRTGGGKAGNLAVGRLSTVMTPILGVHAVSNPVPAEGASDPETIDDLRTAAPQSVRALDRVVSLADYESFARTRPGVGKALATELHVGMRSAVCLTIATTDLTSPVAGSDVVESLRTSLANVSVPGRSVRIEGFTDLRATVGAALAIDPAFRRADVEANVRQRLGAAFGRETRAFGEALYRSAVIAVIQGVEGVVAARLTTFEVPGGPAEDHGRLPCPLPAIVDGTFVSGGLLSIGPDNVAFTEMLA